jgi:hypothetical protein
MRRRSKVIGKALLSLWPPPPDNVLTQDPLGNDKLDKTQLLSLLNQEALGWFIPFQAYVL